MRFVADSRVGLYFVEFGAAPRATEVYYDRAGSAFATAVGVDEALLAGARYAVLSGISLGVSAHARAASLAFAGDGARSGREARGRRQLPRPAVGARGGARRHRRGAA